MTDPIRTVRVFISSPGDVAEERVKAQRVVASLQKRYPGVSLITLLWEQMALPATASFQESIDYLVNRQAVDVAVFILWSRLGSPLGSKLTRPDGTLYRSGTEREFELMLTAFEQSGRQRPAILAYSRDDDLGFRHALAGCPGDHLEEMIVQRKLVDLFVREHFYDSEGRNLRALRIYREPVGFAQQLHLHLKQILDDLLQVNESPRWLDDPYRGLESFELQHATIFHGRDDEIADVLQRLREQRLSGKAFVVIVGASGSGKSSLAKAGVAAALSDHSFDDGVKEWKVINVVPGLSSGDVCGSLATALGNALPEVTAIPKWQQLVARGLAEQPQLTINLNIVPALAHRATTAGGATHILVILDQLEELWTDPQITEQQREQFFHAIEELAESPYFSIVATLRSDFYPQSQLMPAFLRLKGERGHFDLVPLGPAALQRVISEPARLAGLRFERDEHTGRNLEEILLKDAARDAGSLPLLQYTLGELYLTRDRTRQMLTLSAYDALNGVDGAIGKRAAETFHNLSLAARKALPQILPLLVTIDTGGDKVAVRRRAALDELTSTADRKELTNQLIAARFLTTDRIGSFVFASLAHEALLRHWNHLSDWVTTNRDQLRMRASVEQMQERWEQSRREHSLLLPDGLPLEEGKRLAQQTPELLSPATAEYIATSLTHYETLSRKRQRLRRMTLLGMLTLTIIALLGGVFAVTQWQESTEANKLLTSKNRELEQTHESLELTNTELGTAQQRLSSTLAESEQNTRKVQREQIRQYTQRAWREFEKSDARGSLVLAGQALRIASGDAEEEVLAQSRFNHVWHRFPILGYWHDGRVATFSPNGEEFALGETSGLVSLWTADGKKLLANFDGLGVPVVSLTYSANGKQLAAGGAGGYFRVWDRATGKVESTEEGEFQTIPDAIAQIGFLPQGGIAGITSARQAFVAPIKTHKLTLAPDSVGSSFDMSFDQQTVLAVKDGQVRVLQLPDWNPIGTAHTLSRNGATAKFSGDGTLYALTVEEGVAVIEARTGKIVRLHSIKGQIVTLGFDPAGESLVVGSSLAPESVASLPDQQPAPFPNDATSQVEIIPIQEQQPEFRWVMSGAITNVGFSPSGRAVLTVEAIPRVMTSNDGRAESDAGFQIWDARTGAQLSEKIVIDSRDLQCSIGPRGTLLVSTDPFTASTSLWSFSELTSPGFLSHSIKGMDYKGSTFGKQGDDYHIWGTKGVSHWNLKTDQRESTGAEPLESIIFQINRLVTETRMYVSSYVQQNGQFAQKESLFTVAVAISEEQLSVAPRSMMERFTERRLEQFLLLDEVSQLNLPGENLFNGFLRSRYALTSDVKDRSSARVWDIHTNQAVTSRLEGPAPVHRGTFSPNGRYVAVVFRPTEPKMQSANGTTPVDATSTLSANSVTRLTDPGLAQQSIRIWDLQSGQPVTPLFAHPAVSEHLSEDGSTLISICEDHIRAYDLFANPRVPSRSMAIPLSEVVGMMHLDSAGELVPWNSEATEYALAVGRTSVLTKATSEQLDSLKLETLWCIEHGSLRQDPNLRMLAGALARVWISIDPKDPLPWAISANAYGESGDTSLALDHLEKALSAGATDFETLSATAIVNLASGNRVRFTELCQELRSRFAQDPEIHVLDQLVWLHCLLPGDHLVQPEMQQLATKICTAHPNERVHENTQIALNLRTLPKEKLSIETLRSKSTDVPGHEQGTEVLRAIAEYQLAESDAGRFSACETLAGVDANVNSRGRTWIKVSWLERLETNVLLSEARAVAGDYLNARKRFPNEIVQPVIEPAPQPPTIPAPLPPPAPVND